MSPRFIFEQVGVPGTLSAFFDVCGQENKFQPDTRHHLPAVVLHDRGNPIDALIRGYEASLRESSLPDVPFHAYDLQHGRGGYEGLGLETRKKLFARFEGLVRKLPVTYRTFSYRRSEFGDAKALSERMRRDLSAFIRDNYPELQRYATVAIYYDGGQAAADAAIHRAFDETLSANTADYKRLRYQERRLAQAADYFCSMELAALRYADREETNTYIKLFGSRRAFKANHLKQMRRKLHP